MVSKQKIGYDYKTVTYPASCMPELERIQEDPDGRNYKPRLSLMANLNA